MRPRLLLLPFAAALSLASCATNPVTGRREISLVSPEREVQIGREGHEAIVAEYGLYDDPAIAAYVDSVGQSLARVSHLPTLHWTFSVLDEVLNQFGDHFADRSDVHGDAWEPPGTKHINDGFRDLHPHI